MGQNDEGQLMIDNQPVPGTNMVYLMNDVLHKRMKQGKIVNGGEAQLARSKAFEYSTENSR